MIQTGRARLYDETGHFKCARIIYRGETDKALYIMRKNRFIAFWHIPDTWGIEFVILF